MEYLHCFKTFHPLIISTASKMLKLTAVLIVL